MSGVEGHYKLPESWEWMKVGDVIEKVPLTGKKLKTKDYKDKGRFPVIDQGHLFIGGYTDNDKLKIVCDSPVVVFGDHTKAFKYVNFDFVAGADGIKVIKPLNIFDPKLFYYFSQSISLPDKGYARHFQFLDRSLISLPPPPRTASDSGQDRGAVHPARRRSLGSGEVTSPAQAVPSVGAQGSSRGQAHGGMAAEPSGCGTGLGPFGTDRT